MSDRAGRSPLHEALQPVVDWAAQNNGPWATTAKIAGNWAAVIVSMKLSEWLALACLILTILQIIFLLRRELGGRKTPSEKPDAPE